MLNLQLAHQVLPASAGVAAASVLVPYTNGFHKHVTSPTAATSTTRVSSGTSSRPELTIGTSPSSTRASAAIDVPPPNGKRKTPTAAAVAKKSSGSGSGGRGGSDGSGGSGGQNQRQRNRDCAEAVLREMNLA